MKDSHILLLVCRCFETLIVCPCLSLAVCNNTTLLKLKTVLLLFFFPNSALRNRGCGLSMDAAYTRTFTVFTYLKILSDLIVT